MRYLYDYEEFQIEIVSREEDRRMFSDRYLLFYMISGEAAVRIDGEREQISEGDIFLLNSGREARLHVNPEGIHAEITFSRDIVRNYFSDRQVLFDRHVIRRAARKEASEESTHDSRPAPAGELSALVKKILDTSLNLPKGGRSVRMTMLFYQLLLILTDNFRIKDESVSQPAAGQDWKAAVKQWIGLHYSEQIDLKQVAENCFVSYYQLSRSFKSTFGKNFYEYLNDVRMHHVISDLMAGKKKMTDVALDNGYGSAAAFTRAFRKQFGMAPSEYRKALMRRGQEKQLEAQRSRYMALPAQPEPERRQPGFHTVSRGDVRLQQPLDHPFVKMINLGYAADLLRADMQRAVLQLKNELGFPYMRFFNPFSEEMELRESHTTNQLHFSKLDEILDFFVDHGIRPWIDFGDKPKLICRGVYVGEVLVNSQSKEGKPIFRKKSEFREVLTQFMDHIIRRYGTAQTEQWIYEFWDDFYRPERQRGGESVTFFEAFDIASEVIRKRLPQALVGGGGRTLNMTDREFLMEWSRHSRPDFVSAIQYPYRDPLDLDHVEAGKYDMSVDLFARHLDEARQRLRDSGLTTRLFLSEFSADISAKNFQNDSCYQAAWYVRNAMEVIGKADAAGYWCGTDTNFWKTDCGCIFGGPGVVTIDGIRKPVFYAIDFLRQLDRYLIGRDDHSLITADGNGSYTVVLNNYQVMDYTYYLKDEVHTDAGQHIGEKDAGALLQKVIIKHAEPGNYRCRIFRMGPGNGSILEEWARLEFEPELDAADRKYLDGMSSPRVELRHITAKEQLVFEVLLDKEEIMLVKIEREPRYGSL